LSRQDVTSSVPSPEPTGEPPVGGSTAAPTTIELIGAAPRSLVILAWSTGLAGLYVLASLTQAALIERLLSVDVGFGRSLAFWIGTIYLALLGWGFLPSRPSGRYARRPTLLVALVVGLVATAVCGTFTALWLAAHWVPSVGGPVTVSIVVLVVAAVGVLWLAGRDERRTSASE
jgi:hypothetical protein